MYSVKYLVDVIDKWDSDDLYTPFRLHHKALTEGLFSRKELIPISPLELLAEVAE
jgi:hypothetical protein